MVNLIAYTTLVLLSSLLGAVGVQAQQLTLEHRVLLITTKEQSKWATGFIENVMLGYGVPYTTVKLDDKPPASLRSFLWEQYGSSGRYSSIIMYPDFEGSAGLMTKAQYDDVVDYQSKTGARSLRFGSESTFLGMEDGPCSQDGGEMRFTTSAPLGVSGARADAVLPAAELWRCPGLEGGKQSKCCAKLKRAPSQCSQCTAKPILRLSQRATGGAKPAPLVAGALMTNADGRQSMAFTLDCSPQSTACMVLGHVGLSWVMHNMIPGQREAFLNLHVDDFFLATDNGKGGSYRTTPSDVQATAAWQDKISAKLPAGSSIRTELVFNGNGVLIQLDSPAVIENVPTCFQSPDYGKLGCSCWGKAMAACPASQDAFCRNCTKDWKRPRGLKGWEYVPTPDGSKWSDSAMLAGDPLYRLIKTNPDLADSFHWSSHTFSHQMLDNVTYDVTRTQMELNKDIAGPGFLDLLSRPTYSPASMVTPAISGLFNGDALAAIQAFGLTAVTGDNTWPILVNQANPYHPLYTTSLINGFPQPGGQALAIIPRWSTAIAYSVSTLDEALEVYNAEVTPPERVASPSALMQKEGSRVAREGLLSLRADSHMFHQANMRVEGSGGAGSLLMLWAEAALDQFSSVVSWPVKSLKLDDLTQHFVRREARDACGLRYKLTINRVTGGVTGVTVTSKPSEGGGGGKRYCLAPLMVRDGAGLDSKALPVTAAVTGGARTLTARVVAGGSAKLGVVGPWPWPKAKL